MFNIYQNCTSSFTYSSLDRIVKEKKCQIQFHVSNIMTKKNIMSGSKHAKERKTTNHLTTIIGDFFGSKSSSKGSRLGYCNVVNFSKLGRRSVTERERK